MIARAPSSYRDTLGTALVLVAAAWLSHPVHAEDPGAHGNRQLLVVAGGHSHRVTILGMGPEGVRLSPDDAARLQGKLEDWPVGYTQGGSYEVAVTVTDGAAKATGRVTLQVHDQRLWEHRVALRGHDLSLGLRCPLGAIVLASMKLLDGMPMSFRGLELARLLRHRDPAVAEAALAAMQELLADDPEGLGLRIFLHEIEPHLWHFTDFTACLELIDTTIAGVVDDRGADGDLKKLARKLAKTMKAVRAYNQKRGRM